MKKILLILLLFVTILCLYKKNEDYFIIPREAIRFRIVANSNDLNDQLIKERLKNNIEPIINDMLKDVSNIEDARKSINDNIDILNKSIEKFLEENNYNTNFSINYGDNYFPKKNYKGISYKEGKYESLVITLGNGEGDNWWCLLFPPICYLDFGDSEEVEYEFAIKQIFDKLK